MSDTDSITLLHVSGVHEVFVVLETERLYTFVSLVMFVPGKHCVHVSGALQAQPTYMYT